MSKDKRVHQYSIMLYSEKDLNMLLNEPIKRYAYIKHDKDFGSIKRDKKPIKKFNLSKQILKSYHLHLTTHYHLFISFVSARRHKWLDTWKLTNKSEQNIFTEPVKDFDSLMLYFLHKNNPEKHQYDLSEIISDFEIYNVDNLEDVDHLETFQKLDGILNNKYTWYQLFKSNPKLMFSSGSLKTVYNLLKDEKVQTATNENFKKMEQKQQETKAKQMQLIADCENYFENQKENNKGG